MDSSGDAGLDKFLEQFRKACKPWNAELKPPPSIPTSPKNLPLLYGITAVALVGVGWIAVKVAQKTKPWAERVSQDASDLTREKSASPRFSR